QLGQEPDALHGELEIMLDHPAESVVDDEVDGQQDQPDQKMIDREMLEVGLPLRPEYQLPLAQGQQFFDGDEDQGRAEQVEDEPVQADAGRVVGKVADGNARPAERHRGDDQNESQQVELAARAKNDIGQRQAA